MNCVTALTTNIFADCTVQGVGGIEVVAYVGNRTAFDITYDATHPSKFTAIAKASGSTALLYKATSSTNGFDAGHDSVIQAARATRYSHVFNLESFQMSTAAREAIDAMDDLIIFYVRKDKTSDGDGDIIGLGLRYGLWRSADTRREKNAQGARVMEFKSSETAPEPYSAYTGLYPTGRAATLAALEALTVA